MTDATVEPSPPPAAPPPQAWGGGETAAGAATAAALPTARLYLTSDLRAAVGLSRTHMDFYLREGLVRPSARTEGGYLLFDEAELATLRAVLRWRHEGLGLKQIRERLGR